MSSLVIHEGASVGNLGVTNQPLCYLNFFKHQQQLPISSNHRPKVLISDVIAVYTCSRLGGRVKMLV